MSVTINLEDVNDESPRFTMQPIPYLAAFKANLAAGTKVDYGITVNDPDANSALRYSLLEGLLLFYNITVALYILCIF